MSRRSTKQRRAARRRIHGYREAARWRAFFYSLTANEAQIWEWEHRLENILKSVYEGEIQEAIQQEVFFLNMSPEAYAAWRKDYPTPPPWELDPRYWNRVFPMKRLRR